METLSNLSPLCFCFGFLALTHGFAMWLGSKQIWNKRIRFEDRNAPPPFTPPIQTITGEDPVYRTYDPTQAPRGVQNE